MDRITPQARSRLMSKIRSKDTKPELLVRKFLHAQGYRYRIHVRNMLGQPDIVLPRYKTIVFVHGCFWHGHEDPNCRFSRVPKTNTEFWEDKMKYNQSRHAKNLIELAKQGWHVITVWECGLKGPTSQAHLQQIAKEISSNKH